MSLFSCSQEIIYSLCMKVTNEKLNDSVSELSEQIGRLEAKESDLVTQLQLKVCDQVKNPTCAILFQFVCLSQRNLVHLLVRFVHVML